MPFTAVFALPRASHAETMRNNSPFQPQVQPLQQPPGAQANSPGACSRGWEKIRTLTDARKETDGHQVYLTANRMRGGKGIDASGRRNSCPLRGCFANGGLWPPQLRRRSVPHFHNNVKRFKNKNSPPWNGREFSRMKISKAICRDFC